MSNLEPSISFNEAAAITEQDITFNDSAVENGTESEVTEAIESGETVHDPSLIKRIGAKVKGIFQAAVETTTQVAQKVGEAAQGVAEKARLVIGEVKEKCASAFREYSQNIVKGGVALALTAVTIWSAASLGVNASSEAPGPNSTDGRKRPNGPKTPYNYSFNIGETGEGDASMYAGELPNGVHYDYTEYFDRDNKISYNAFGYDQSESFGNKEATIDGISKVVWDMPTALATIVYNLFDNDEKKEYRIEGMNPNEIHQFMINSEDGGAIQEKLFNKTKEILGSSDTTYSFYYENDIEETNYIYFFDMNQNGKASPSELTVSYDVKKRNKAPQVDVSRKISYEGTTYSVKVLDLNYKCRYQPNYELGEVPEGVPYIPDLRAENPNPKKDTPDPTKPTEPNDSKNAEAIKKNMQTGSETSNVVEPAEAGKLTEQPDTSHDSYKEEQYYQEKTVSEARSQESESRNGGTVGEVINNADQTYSNHEAYTPAQQEERAAEAQGARDQEVADAKAVDSQPYEQMDDSAAQQYAAEWFNTLQNGN